MQAGRSGEPAGEAGSRRCRALSPEATLSISPVISCTPPNHTLQPADPQSHAADHTLKDTLQLTSHTPATHAGTHCSHTPHAPTYTSELTSHAQCTLQRCDNEECPAALESRPYLKERKVRKVRKVHKLCHIFEIFCIYCN